MTVEELRNSLAFAPKNGYATLTDAQRREKARLEALLK